MNKPRNQYLYLNHWFILHILILICILLKTDINIEYLGLTVWPLRNEYTNFQFILICDRVLSTYTEKKGKKEIAEIDLSIFVSHNNNSVVGIKNKFKIIPSKLIYALWLSLLQVQGEAGGAAWGCEAGGGNHHQYHEHQHLGKLRP